jgi:hypothetical protein
MTRKECGFWLAISLLGSALIGVIGGILEWAASHNMTDVVFQGAATFTAAEMLFLAILGFVVAATNKVRKR